MIQIFLLFYELLVYFPSFQRMGRPGNKKMVMLKSIFSVIFCWAEIHCESDSTLGKCLDACVSPLPPLALLHLPHPLGPSLSLASMDVGQSPGSPFKFRTSRQSSTFWHHPAWNTLSSHLKILLCYHGGWEMGWSRRNSGCTKSGDQKRQ